MSILKGLTTDANIQNETDYVGYEPLDTDLYDGTVEVAFITLATSKAMALNVHIKTANGLVKQQFWMTSGEDKGCKNTYKNKKGDLQYLPGFLMANGLCLLTVGKEINALDTEKKVINLYDPAASKEVPTPVDMITELIGKEIAMGVIKKIVDKTKKGTNAAGDPAYLTTGEVRTENEIDKFFRKRDGFTVTEIRAGATESVFKAKWLDKWKGVVKDKATRINEATGEGPVSPTGSNAPVDALFA